jgi:hypothetical protein
MIDSTAALLDELRARGLVAADASPIPSPPRHDRPWYIGLLLGTAGWFAGLFVLVFVFMIFSPKSEAVAFVAAPVLLGAAWTLFKVDRDGVFVSQLALALSIAGQVAALIGVGEWMSHGAGELARIAIAALVLQVALVFAMPNRLHRTMSALFACLAWGVSVRYGLWDVAGTPAAMQPHPEGLALLGWAIVWLPVAGLLFVIVRREPAWMARGWQEIVRPLAAGLIIGLALGTLVSQPFETFSMRAAHGDAMWPLLSALAALGALTAAFALGHRGLTAVCILAALAHLSHFYYAMGTSLLVKSLALAVAGAILLWTARSLRSRA